MSKPKPIPTDIGEHLAYDPDTGLLTWLRKQVPGNSPAAGEPAGYPHAAGCILVSFRGKMYGVHRVAWFLMTGQQPPLIVDHRDLDRANNRWTNLRPATKSQNAANTRGSTARDLPKGVYRMRDKFQSAIVKDGKLHFLGTFKTPAEAQAAYWAGAVALFGEYARAG